MTTLEKPELKEELRTFKFNVENIQEVKSLHDGDEDFFEVKGYATKFFGIDTFGDQIRPGAYLKTIANNPDGFPALFMHDSFSMPVGQFFKLEEDKTGLLVTARLPKSDTFVSGRLIPQMKTGSIDALSIGYRVEKASFEVIDDQEIRVLEIIELREISFITKGYQADSGALLTELKNKNSKDVYNMMVEAKRKGCKDDLKNEIIEYYHEKGMDSPFADDSVMCIDELKSLSKSNKAYAIRKLSLSAKTANYLAELVGVSESSIVKGSEGADDAESKDKDSIPDVAELDKTKGKTDGEPDEEEEGKSESLDDLIKSLKQLTTN